ncbi:FabD/lysophospholipase-like protein [Acephala macrosclerotiorum]|nr:FabD/lysophospholipase-like protein [Acephala macrosclerotiorum]
MQSTVPPRDNPLNQDGLCVLSLDGGGVRGLSTLLIVKALMAKVNAERKKDGQPYVKPCELFDLIGGTSTGGIIAIMLGRLEMDVDDCIEAYTSMFQTIFGKKGLPVNMWGKIKGRFDSTVLEECIRKILKGRGLSDAEPLNDGKERCKVVVCAKAFEVTATVLLRSYASTDALNNIPATICEAVRATSAATSFFEPVTIGPRRRKFVDGGLGANNPVEQLWNEAQNIWCHDEGMELSRLLKCFVSIGTGNPGRKAIAEGSLKFFSETLVGIATQTEDTAKIFVERHRRLYEGKRYFRFNVQQGLQDVGLEEYQAAALIDAATAEYMDGQETRSAAQQCAMNLKQKQFHLEFSPKQIIEWDASERRSTRRQKAITLIPFSRNNGLVNRDDAFKALDRLLSLSSPNRSAAIWGLGGCGKTQIALEYAYRRQDATSCSVFWVHADSEARFTQGYSDLGKIAGLSQDLKGEDLLRAVQQWIDQQTNWLLVLDNADDLRIFKTAYSAPHGQQSQSPELLRFVPKNQSGTVIWTSRDGGILGSIVGVDQGVEVGAMTTQESWKMFQRLSGRDDMDLSENEDKLLELLQRLPLAIAQAAAYIRKTKVSVQQYLQFFSESESRQSNILSQEFPDVYRSGVPNSVMNTWLISMRQIAEESPCGEKILNIIAFLDNKRLPFELLKAAAGPDFDEDMVLLATSRLIEYSFLQAQRVVDEGLPTYEQHRLVHLATRRALTQTQTCSFSGEALGIMTDLFPDGKYGTWTSCKLYLPHALKAATWIDAEAYNDQAPSLLRHIGNYYWEQGRSTEAEQFEVQVLELQKEVLGEKHPDTIAAMANLASTWRQQGRLTEAEQFDIQVLELRKEVLGEKHPSTILDIQVLELRKEVLGEKHPSTILSMANLANTWWQQGRLIETEQLEIQVLKLRKEVLGEKHPDTIEAMENLAITRGQLDCNNRGAGLEIMPSNYLNNLRSVREGTNPNKSQSRLKTWSRKIIKWKRPEDS